MTTVTGLCCILKGSEDRVSFCFEGLEACVCVCVCVRLCLKNWHEKLFAMLISFFFSYPNNSKSKTVHFSSSPVEKHN